MRHRRRSVAVPLALLGGLIAIPAGVAAQDDAVAAYHRGVAEHFDIPPGEIRILAQSALRPEEVPVALFLARRAGISADALVALKRGGRGWDELARRYDLGPGDFHVPLQESVDPGPLARAYDAFRSTPSSEWDGLRLTDDEVIHLVNLKILSVHLDVAPGRVLELRVREGSFVAAYATLLRGIGRP